VVPFVDEGMRSGKAIYTTSQGSARDFASAKDWESYAKNDLGHHAGTFFFSGLGGVLQGHAGDNGLVNKITNPFASKATRLGLNAVGYGMEYVGMSHVKGNYQAMYHKGWEGKARIYSFKSIMYVLIP